MTFECPGNGRFTQLILYKSEKETRRLSTAQSQTLSTSRRAQVAGAEKKETAHIPYPVQDRF